MKYYLQSYSKHKDSIVPNFIIYIVENFIDFISIRNNIFNKNSLLTFKICNLDVFKDYNDEIKYYFENEYE